MNHSGFCWSRDNGVAVATAGPLCKSSALCSKQITMPTPHHSVFTGQMLFLPLNQQRHSTECKDHIPSNKQLLSHTIHYHIKLVLHHLWVRLWMTEAELVYQGWPLYSALHRSKWTWVQTVSLIASDQTRFVVVTMRVSLCSVIYVECPKWPMSCQVRRRTLLNDVSQRQYQCNLRETVCFLVYF